MAKAKGRNLSVNMKDVDGGSVLIPEGDYMVEVTSVEVAESESSGKEYLKWKLEIVTEGSVKGQTVFHNTSLQPQALFNLKGVLISLGMEVPDKTLNLDLDDIEGRQMGITIEHEVYEGKKKARVTETFPLGDSDSEDDDDTVDPSTLDLDELLEFADEHGIEIPAKSKKNKAKALAFVLANMPADEADDEPADEDEADDEEESDGLDDMDLKELKKHAKTNDIDLSDLSAKDAKNADKVREAIRAAGESTDEEEAEDDDAPDFDEMSLKEMKAYAAENDIDIPAKIAKKEDKVRELLKASVEDEAEGVDLDAMDLDELLAFAAEQDIAISKKFKTNEKKVRAYIASEMEDED